MQNKVNYESSFVKLAMDHQWKEVLAEISGSHAPGRGRNRNASGTG